MSKKDLNPQVAKLLQIKRNKYVRIACLPFFNSYRLFKYLTFRLTKDADYIRSFHHRFDGKRCFIIGNGPSLNIKDLEALNGEYTFASNRIYNIFSSTNWRPSFYMCYDPVVISMEIDEIRKMKIKRKFVSHCAKKYGRKKEDFLHYFFPNGVFTLNRDNFEQKKISEDVSKYFSITHTVTCLMIEFAIYMGFKEIYLIGCDHNYSKTRDKNGKLKIDANVLDYAKEIGEAEYSVQNLEATTKCYQLYKKYGDEHQIAIKNATRGGKLEVFERISLDELLS